MFLKEKNIDSPYLIFTEDNSENVNEFENKTIIKWIRQISYGTRHEKTEIQKSHFIELWFIVQAG